MKVVSTYAIETPCAVTDVKYVSAVRKGAGSGLRAHICQTPSTAATAKAAKANHICARVRRLAYVTGRPPVGAGLELGFGHDLHGRPHLAVPEAAIFVAGHQEVAGPGEDRVHLADVARDDHRVDVRAGDQDAVDHVGGGKAQ